MATVAEFLSALRNSSPQVHILHNQTKVYSEHVALGDYYDDVLDLIDRIAETYTALYGEIEGYQSKPYFDWTSTQDTIKYFQALYSYVQSSRNIFTDSFIQNIVDELSELIAQTLFRLSLNQM
jgi:hypothetical protein